jgi:hypothetical protein
MYLKVVVGEDVTWNGFFWPSTETIGWLLRTQWQTFGFHKTRGLSWPAEKLLAFQKSPAPWTQLIRPIPAYLLSRLLVLIRTDHCKAPHTEIVNRFSSQQSQFATVTRAAVIAVFMLQHLLHFCRAYSRYNILQELSLSQADRTNSCLYPYRQFVWGSDCHSLLYQLDRKLSANGLQAYSISDVDGSC